MLDNHRLEVRSWCCHIYGLKLLPQLGVGRCTGQSRPPLLWLQLLVSDWELFKCFQKCTWTTLSSGVFDNHRVCESHTVRSEKTSHEPFHRCCTCPGKSRMKYHGQCMVARNRADDIGIRFGKPIIAPSCQYVFGVDILVYKVSKKACLNKSLQKPSSRKQQLPDCISTESSSAEARLKNFTGDSRYDFCCCAMSSTQCYRRTDSSRQGHARMWDGPVFRPASCRLQQSNWISELI